MPRPEINLKIIDNIIKYSDAQWTKELNKKGLGIFVSSHEILGCLVEETREFEEAIQKNDLEKLKDELTDILIVALHGLASIETGEMDWPKKNKEKGYCHCKNPTSGRKGIVSQSSNFIDSYTCNDCGGLIK